MPNTPEEVEFEPVYGTTGNDIILEVSNATDYYGGMGNDVFIAASIDLIGQELATSTTISTAASVRIRSAISCLKRRSRPTWRLEPSLVAAPGYFSIDYLYSIEDLMGTNFNDTIVGSNGANHLWGFGGNDVIHGLGGNDHLSGDSGNDTLHGGDGNDVIDGGTGNDTSGTTTAPTR